MRPLGSILMIGGAAVGAMVAVAMLGGIHVANVPLIVAIGLGKLTLLTSGGLMAAGAVCNRLALRKEQRELLDRASEDQPPQLR
ncbi:MAG: hypothetical protein ABI625_03775 [bacterium]